MLQRLVGLGAALVLGAASLGCAARYSPEQLQAMAPQAEYVEVCTHPPTVDHNSVAFAHNARSNRTVSDANWTELEEFAKKEADRMFRYDPNAPEKTTSRLPWPYQTMLCRTLAAPETPALPAGMKEIPISREMREALISALMDRASLFLRAPQQEETSRIASKNKQYLAGGPLIGPYIDGRSPQERIEATGQMLRDAIRAVLPKVQGPQDTQISVIDTKTGQIIGGLGAGTVASNVPGGVFIADALEKDGVLPRATPQFKAGQGAAEMGVGFVQMIGGGTMGVVGGGASLTGGGALIGVPTCVAGVALAANGAITFIHGAQTVLVAVCNWDANSEFAYAQPLAAVAPKDAAAGPPPPPTSPASAPAPVKPPPAPVQATPVKPVAAAPSVKAPPAKPAPVKPAPPSTEPIVVRTSPGGTTTTTRPRLKDGQQPCETTLKVRTDEAGHVVSMEVTTTEKAVSAELKPYGGPGGGHHVPAKKVFEGAPNYDPKKALAIPNAELDRLGINHTGKVTPAQQLEYMEFAKSRQPLTWDAVARIETKVLVKSGMNLDMAKATVTKAIQALKDSGVAGPIRIPWGK